MINIRDAFKVTAKQRGGYKRVAENATPEDTHILASAVLKLLDENELLRSMLIKMEEEWKEHLLDDRYEL